MNDERLDRAESDAARDIEAKLKPEADRLHQELVRRLPSGFDHVRQQAPGAVIGIGGTVAAALILHYGFGIG